MIIDFEGKKAVKELLSGVPIEELKQRYPDLVKIKKAPSLDTKGSH